MRTLLPFMIFLSVFLGLMFGIHAYVATGLVLDPQWGAPYESLGLWAIAVLGSLMVFNMMSGRVLGIPASRIIAWPAYVWMATVFYLLLALGVSDLVLWAVGADAVETMRLRAFVAGGISLVAIAVGLRGGMRRPQVKKVEIRLPRWPAALDGYRIVQISDVHIGTLLRRPFAQYIADTANALSPDLTAVTGDLVDGSVTRLRDQVAPLSELRARDGVFFVTGNHDHYSGARDWVQEVSNLGMHVLFNSHQVIRRGDAAFTLAGVNDHTSGQRSGDREDLPAAFAGRDPNLPTILLAHNPQTLVEASKLGVDLQISGHTHGGQMWPFKYAVRLQTLWVAGLYSWRDSLIYVSQGTGFWGPPVRLGAPAEITELTLRRLEPAEQSGT